MIFNLLATMLFSSLALAAGRTEGVLQTEYKDNTFTATVKDGFHFNDKAPNAAVIDGKSIKPSTINTKNAAFTSLPANFKEGRASLFICDDDVTFCEAKLVVIKGNTATAIKTPPREPGFGKTNKNGFIVEDYNQALALAKKKKQLLLIDFGARWCPGCVRLESEIFPTREFKNLTSEFVKLKIDVDRFENNVISEKYHISGIPSLVVVTADQEEIDRIYDYQPLEVIGRFVANVKGEPMTLRELMERAQAGDQATLLLLGKRLLNAERANEAVSYLEKVSPAPPELIDARIKASSNGDAQLREAIKAEPNSIRSLGWRVELAGATKKAAEKQKLKEDGVALADDFLSHPEKIKAASQETEIGEFTGFEPLMIAMSRAELIETANPGKEAEEAWKKAAQIGTDLKIPAKNAGISMRHLLVLNKAKHYDQADALSKKLVKSSPHDAELQRRRLGILVELKKYNEAIKLGKSVLKNSYGRNEFWTAQTLAKAYVHSNHKKEAREFISKYLARGEMGWPEMKGTKKAFEDLLNKVPKT
jgi:thioredoxin-like negative regulator of GroEL